MDDLIDLIASEASPSDVSDSIKSILFAKSAEKIEQIKPYVASSLFGVDNNNYEEDYDGE